MNWLHHHLPCLPGKTLPATQRVKRLRAREGRVIIAVSGNGKSSHIRRQKSMFLFYLFLYVWIMFRIYHAIERRLLADYSHLTMTFCPKKRSI
jgi:hypothetical protein